MSNQNKPIEMTDAQKLIVALLIDNSRPVDQRQYDYELIESALFGGNSWAVRRKYSGIFIDEDPDPQIVKEVADAFMMWSFVENAVGNFSATQKTEYESLVGEHDQDPKYLGYDGNNETDHYSATEMMVESLDKFGEFFGREHNSHLPTAQTYRQMVHEFKRVDLGHGGRTLTPSEVAGIVNAGRI